MSARNYRQDYADTDLPLDVLRDDAGAYRAPADWISLPNGTAGDSVDITTFHGNESRTYTVGADGVTSWMVEGQIRSVDDVDGAGNDAVSIGTGNFVASSGPQGPAGPAGADGADGATGPQGPPGEPLMIEGTIDLVDDDLAGLGAGVKTLTKTIYSASANTGGLYLVGIELLDHTPFTDGGAGTYSMILGDAVDDDKYITATDVKAAVTAKVANAGIHMFPGKNLADSDIKVKLTSSVDLNTCDAGHIKVRMVCFQVEA